MICCSCRASEIQFEVLLQTWTPDYRREVEQCFHQALTIARRQQAKSLELRAA